MVLLYQYTPLGSNFRLTGVFQNVEEYLEFVQMATPDCPYVIVKADFDEPPAVLRYQFLSVFAEIWVHIPAKCEGSELRKMFIKELMLLLQP